jgi:sugar phosphate isomerase/epimerase
MARFAPDIPLALAHLSELDTPPHMLVEIAARAGFASTGLRTYPAAPGAIAYTLAERGERQRLRHACGDAGITIDYVEMISIDDALDVASCRATLEIGAEIGATRLAVAGNSADVALVGDKLAALCDIAAPLGMAVDIEFMPFRAVRGLAEALAVVERAARPNAHVLVDALHIFRSGSSLDRLRGAARARLGTFQICDAPREAPADLIAEARTRRLLPGDGGLALADLLDALPAELAVGVEIPLASQRPDLDPAARLALLVTRTREFLARLA